jgi:hypothetical protein
MTIQSRIVPLVAGVTAAAVVASGCLFAVAGAASAQSRSSDRTAIAAKSGFTGCTRFYYCDYTNDNGTHLCFRAGTFSGPGDVANWATYGCRNVDGAFYNNSPFTVRIYFAPHYGDPHACIKPYTKIRDLFNYDFNNGRGPHNLVIGNDIASSTISLSPCTNPL